MLVLGLTGSVGMGKSTTAGFFVEAGVPVHDADAAVHRLYAGEAAPLIEAAFPGTTSGATVDRTVLAKRVLVDPAALKRLETIVHPLVRASERRFLAEAEARGDNVVVLDIPLLFETGGEERFDAVVVITAPADVRAKRTGRAGDTRAARLLPEAEKVRRADFAYANEGTLDELDAFVGQVLDRLTG
jgi:dephospho-CoA kinase